MPRLAIRFPTEPPRLRGLVLRNVAYLGKLTSLVIRLLTKLEPSLIFPKAALRATVKRVSRPLPQFVDPSPPPTAPPAAPLPPPDIAPEIAHVAISSPHFAIECPIGLGWGAAAAGATFAPMARQTRLVVTMSCLSEIRLCMIER